MVAIRKALQWLDENSSHIKAGSEIRICTDSQAAVRTLQAGPTKQKTKAPDDIWWLLNKLSSRYSYHFTIQWVPSHCGLLGNEMADLIAKEASALDQNAACIDQSSAEAVIKRKVREDYYRNLTDNAAVNIMKRRPQKLKTKQVCTDPKEK